MFSLKLILYFFSFIFIYNILLYFFPSREGAQNMGCSAPTTASNNAQIEVVKAQVDNLNDLQKKVNDLKTQVATNSDNIMKLSTAQTAQQAGIVEDQDIDM